MKEYQKYLTELFGIGKKSNPTVEDVYNVVFKWGRNLGRGMISNKLMKKIGLDEMKAGEIEGIIMSSAKKVFEKYDEEITKSVDRPDFEKKVFTKGKPYKQAFVDKEPTTNFADLMYDIGLTDEMRSKLEEEIKRISYNEIQEVLDR